MQIIDWIIIGIILIFALIGFGLGFVKMIFKLGKGLIAYFIAYLLCKPVTKLVSKMGFYLSVNNKLVEWLSTKGEVFSQPITEESIGAIGESLKLPSFLSDLITKALNNTLGELAGSGVTLGQAVSELFSVQLILNHGTVATSESLQLNGCSDDVERAKDLFNFLKTEILASAREFRLNEKQTGLQFRSFAKGCSDAAYDYCHEKSTLLKKDIFQQQVADEIKTIKATPFHRFVYKSMDRYSYRCGRIKGLELIKSTTKIQ